MAVRSQRTSFSQRQSGKRRSNLSELQLTLGDLTGALQNAERSVTYANRNRDALWEDYVLTRITHANALHQAGLRAEAEARFREAETGQAKSQPDYPLLYSLRGFYYCDLLLTAVERGVWRRECGVAVLPVGLAGGGGAGTGAERPSQPAAGMVALIKSCRAVEQRASQTLKWEEKMRGAPILDPALHHLTLARVGLYRFILEDADLRFVNSAFSHIGAAVNGLRRACHLDHLPRALLTRAWVRSRTGCFTGPESAQSDLEEAWEIVERGPMPLFQADIHLHRARLFGMRKAEERRQNRQTTYPWESPQANLAEARRLIYKHGYLRRKEELEDAEQALLR